MAKSARALLLVLDGWGLREETSGNAIRLARTPHWDALLASSVHTRLQASGVDVGLPAGLMGNSEVGHLNIGAGRVVYQDIQRINKAIADGSFFVNAALTGLMRPLARSDGALHLMGLVSDGGVHSMDTHLAALVEMARREGVQTVEIHAFLDGRDTPPRSARQYLGRLEARLREIGTGRIATVSGRYYAMDRDQRWERTERAWRAMVLGEAPACPSADAAVERSYAAGKGDEFVEPVRVSGAVAGDGVQEGDGVMFFNFRADRARQLTRALTETEFRGFDRPRAPRVSMATMTEYDPAFAVSVAFAPESLRGIFADALGDAQCRNLRVAETEKYAHVTYFFNGGVEEPWPGEERILVPSPRVATYDLEPAMSAAGVTERILEGLERTELPIIVANYANADMVGHTGDLAATVAAVETIDASIGRLVAAADRLGVAVLITADHGNAEQMIDPVTSEPHTAHTTNPVPFVVRAPGFRGRLDEGRLADVAPTLLELTGLKQPTEMTGRSLLR